METIEISSGRNWYPLMHTLKRSKNGFEMTGCYPGHDWKIGEILDCKFHNFISPNMPRIDSGYNPYFLKVAEVIETRDSKMRFERPEEKTNSFFKIRVEFVRNDEVLN